MALSDAAIRQAKSTGKDYIFGDIDGLSLAVTASGGRSWHFRYCWSGKQKRMSLGTYPQVFGSRGQFPGTSPGHP
ncbi:DUF4102 domain-containing protein [Pseudomonas marginalis]|nr:DUF4102 domain-containing protein [Pseudomonas marginalis]